ncbi:hypothetical protein QZH45_22060 [Pseudomonas corrugata]|jgi:Ca2+-binding EF-hand superfamily protein|uniref:EF-hand domain-containing protein n=1 Tax=Pseudomonas corrugata TaxID=47879 RepID=A0A3M3DX84_9PSED|nr:hypothetical protein [Pseudomonas corrugata]MDU9023884.1 hypothetical protein [Pseudomonas corrugata]RMM41973.1 hypothetical protein ALQ77_03098 [Pseudomonas corrugata]SDU86137.1 hypothetical protein SAMN04490183_0710 [Pseudomonas corrugata]
MIGSVSSSSYSTYTSINRTATNSARDQQFQKELLGKLDSDGDGSVTASELTSVLQSSDSSTTQSSVSEALNRMITNLSRQYSLDDVASVGKHLNVAT